MISGAHVIIYSTDATADRAFLRDVLGLPAVDSGGGWLIFALPPSEVAVHPFDTNGQHELFFLVKDINVFLAAMRGSNVPTTPIQPERWGLLTHVTLPGGSKISVYEPLHPRPRASRSKARAKPASKAKRSVRTTATPTAR